MVEFLNELADEGIKAFIDTATRGMMKITLTREHNHSCHYADLKGLIQSDSPDGTFIELLHHTYYELKELEAKLVKVM